MKRLPSPWVYFCLLCLACVLLISLVTDSSLPVGTSVVSGVATLIFYYSIYLVTGSKGIGFGDVKLAPILVGTAGLLGGERAIAAFMFPYFLAAFALVYFLLVKKMTRKTAIPLGPFLIIGFYFAILLPDELQSNLFALLAL